MKTKYRIPSHLKKKEILPIFKLNKENRVYDNLVDACYKVYEYLEIEMPNYDARCSAMFLAEMLLDFAVNNNKLDINLIEGLINDLKEENGQSSTN